MLAAHETKWTCDGSKSGLIIIMPVPMDVDQQAMSMETACSVVIGGSTTESINEALTRIAQGLSYRTQSPALSAISLNTLIPYLSQQDTVSAASAAVKAYIKLQSFEELTTSYSVCVHGY